MKVFRATIAYDGTGFSGVAEQITKPEAVKIRTVIGELRPIVEVISQSKATINVSGRTDKGVHAREQVVSFNFETNPEIDLDIARLIYVCNKKLNPEIVILDCIETESQFHARFSAKSRTYRYFLDTNKTPDIFSARFAWHVGKPLQLDEMEVAAQLFVGEQDFTSVCKRDESVPHNIREVFESRFIEHGFKTVTDSSLLCFQIKANAFCWNMVRSIVGVLVDVGARKIKTEDIAALLEAKQRDSSRTFAPPHGLTLWDVKY